MLATLAAAMVAASLSVIQASSAETGSYDLAVYLQSWATVSGEENISAVWRVENHGPATTASAQAILSQPSSPSSPFKGYEVPPLAGDAIYTVTTSAHVGNTSSFVLQMHVGIQGLQDSNTGNDDALLAVGYPPGGGGGGGSGGANPMPAAPTVKFEVPQLDLLADPGRCRVIAPEPPIRIDLPGNPNDYASGGWSILYPDGTTDDLWPSFRSSNGSFPVGTTRVSFKTYVKQDPASASEDTMTVVVRDKQAPRVPATFKAITRIATAKAGVRVSFRHPRSVDNCPGTLIASKPRSGSLFHIGTTTVTFTATDRSGNTGKATMKVVVLRPKPKHSS